MELDQKRSMERKLLLYQESSGKARINPNKIGLCKGDDVFNRVRKWPQLLKLENPAIIIIECTPRIFTLQRSATVQFPVPVEIVRGNFKIE